MTEPARNAPPRGMVANNSQNSAQWPKAVIACALVLFSLTPLLAQVSPVEIQNPRLKAAEQTYLPQLLALNQAISEIKFPFKFSLNRYVGLDPKDQVGADTRGLEFVDFHDRRVMKITGNYNAAYNADGLTPNRRAGRVLNEVVLPVLRMLPDYFSERDDFDAFGFEIGYHVRRHDRSYDYEGKEFLVVVLDKSDGLRYGALREDARRQEILNGSEIYLNGKPFGIALNTDEPVDVETLVRRTPGKRIYAEDRKPLPAADMKELAPSRSVAGTQAPAQRIPAKTASGIPPSELPAVKTDLDALQEKYRSELEALHKEGVAKYHFVDYAPLSFVAFRNQAALQVTLRSTESFDKDATSIYRRAARTFDLFLAPQLKGMLEKIPESPDFNTLDCSIILNLTSVNAPKSSEAIEFILPLKLARRFAAADITNQDLIDESAVLVNGVRISLNLAQVE
jgi:hypothetical protein